MRARRPRRRSSARSPRAEPQPEGQAALVRPERLAAVRAGSATRRCSSGAAGPRICRVTVAAATRSGNVDGQVALDRLARAGAARLDDRQRAAGQARDGQLGDDDAPRPEVPRLDQPRVQLADDARDRDSPVAVREPGLDGRAPARVQDRLVGQRLVRRRAGAQDARR